jgi:hypothetical protein
LHLGVLIVLAGNREAKPVPRRLDRGIVDALLCCRKFRRVTIWICSLTHEVNNDEKEISFGSGPDAPRCSLPIKNARQPDAR